MPNWNDVYEEIRSNGSNYDIIRREYLKRLHELTGRNIIVYYSGWLQKLNLVDSYSLSINDADKIGFMSTIHKLDPDKGLDLFLHTPGGGTAATESLVDYLRSVFGKNIRAIVPQLAMSAGTMIACACDSIVMGKQSSLGPIDPQIGNGIPAHGILEEAQRAFRECKDDPSRVPVWQVLISKYSPTLIGECEKSITWSNEIVKEWLVTGMLRDDLERDSKADGIIENLGNHALTKSHARHISAEKCREYGLTIDMLEDDQNLQEAVLAVHHACIHTLSSTASFKIIENHLGVAYVQSQPQIVKV